MPSCRASAARWRCSTPQESQLRADAKAKQAALDFARITLGYTKIVAPVDGMVSERGVREGQYVHAGTQIISVVPLENVWVVANYKETQLTHVAIGQQAEITVDTFPGVGDHGPCRQHRPGERLAVQPAAARQRHRQLHQGRAAHPGQDRARSGRTRSHGKLRPGMSVVATILTDTEGSAPAMAPAPAKP